MKKQKARKNRRPHPHQKAGKNKRPAAPLVLQGDEKVFKDTILLGRLSCEVDKDKTHRNFVANLKHADELGISVKEFAGLWIQSMITDMREFDDQMVREAAKDRNTGEDFAFYERNRARTVVLKGMVGEPIDRFHFNRTKGMLRLSNLTDAVGMDADANWQKLVAELKTVKSDGTGAYSMQALTMAVAKTHRIDASSVVPAFVDLDSDLDGIPPEFDEALDDESVTEPYDDYASIMDSDALASAQSSTETIDGLIDLFGNLTRQLAMEYDGFIEKKRDDAVEYLLRLASHYNAGGQRDGGEQRFLARSGEIQGLLIENLGRWDGASIMVPDLLLSLLQGVKAMSEETIPWSLVQSKLVLGDETLRGSRTPRSARMVFQDVDGNLIAECFGMKYTAYFDDTINYEAPQSHWTKEFDDLRGRLWAAWQPLISDIREKALECAQKDDDLAMWLDEADLLVEKAAPEMAALALHSERFRHHLLNDISRMLAEAMADMAVG